MEAPSEGCFRPCTRASQGRPAWSGCAWRNYKILGFRVRVEGYGVGFRVRFKVKGLGLGCRVRVLGSRPKNDGLQRAKKGFTKAKVYDLGFRATGRLGLGLQNLGFRLERTGGRPRALESTRAA